MIESMTGYGSASIEHEHYSISTEIKCLNSKFADINLRIPPLLYDKEIELRKTITDGLKRGKISITIEVIIKNAELQTLQINEELFKAYFKQLSTLADEVGADKRDLMRIVLQSPEVSNSKKASMDDDLYAEVKKCLNVAMENCAEFRKAEGIELQKELLSYNKNIRIKLKEIQSIDSERIDSVRKRITQNLSELKTEIDENRLEQELIYYVEKLDISEEITRLNTHLDYFEKTISDQQSQGKKLGFISQEMGREINTIGSKANYAATQKLVVEMKDELEKIKEQSLNII